MANVADFREQHFEPLGRRWLAFVLAVVFLIANLLVIEIAYRFASWANLFRSSPWNWFGKAISIGFTCSVLACSPWLRQNIGLRWRQTPGSLSLSIGCLATFLACAIGIGFLMPPMVFSTDTLMFQFFIPAIDEELMFRGIVLAIGTSLRTVADEFPITVRICGADYVNRLRSRTRLLDRGRSFAFRCFDVFVHGRMGCNCNFGTHSLGKPDRADYSSCYLGRRNLSGGNAAVSSRTLSLGRDVRRNPRTAYMPDQAVSFAYA